MVFISTCQSISKHCAKLQRLDLGSCCAISDLSLKALADGCSYLTHINISWCENITDIGQCLTVCDKCLLCVVIIEIVVLCDPSIICHLVIRISTIRFLNYLRIKSCYQNVFSKLLKIILY